MWRYFSLKGFSRGDFTFQILRIICRKVLADLEGERERGRERIFLPFSLSPCLLFLFICLLFNLSYAQHLVLTARGSTAFIPSVKEYTDALLCTGCNTLLPTRLNDKIELKLENRAAQAVTLQVRRDAYLPNADLELEARYTFLNAQGNIISAYDWLPLSQLPTTLYSGRDSSVSAAIEYRLFITGHERSGSYETSVTYNLNASTGAQSVTHKLRFALPEVALLQVRGQVGSTATVAFDYQGVNAVQYVRAVQNKTPLAPTSSGFQHVEVFCNSAKGYTVTVQLFEVSSNPLGSTLNKLYLFGKVAQNQRLQRTSATDSLQILVRPEDFSLLVDGSEEAGSFRFVVQYQIAVNR
jgi:hypothetical protein